LWLKLLDKVLPIPIDELEDSFGKNCIARLEISFWAAGTVPGEQTLQLQVDIIQLNRQVQLGNFDFISV